MRNLQNKIEIKKGAKVDTFFSAHLVSYKGTQGATLVPRDSSVQAALEVYADYYFLAALNYWELYEGETIDTFPYKRGDFHAWMELYPKEFGEAVKFAAEAMSGKTFEQLLKEKLDESKKKTEGPDWDAIERFLVGTLGMSEDEAAYVSFREYGVKLQAWCEAQQQKWEIARWEAWNIISYCSIAKPKDKPRTPKQLCAFPWEEPDAEALKKKAENCTVSDAEKNELNRIFAEIEKQNKK